MIRLAFTGGLWYLFYLSLFAVRDALKTPEFRALAITTVTTLILGTWFYHRAEGWNWLDSFYFCVITLTTIGYGDITRTPLGVKYSLSSLFSWGWVCFPVLLHF